MVIGQVIKDALDRNERYMLAALSGLSPEELRTRPAPESNPIGWLMWHLSRVQDYAVSTITEQETVWVREGWHERFGMAPDPAYRGNGDSPEQVDRFTSPDAETLAAYYRAVRANTDAFLDSLSEADLTRMVPPVRGTELVPLAERLPGVIVETIHHGGQVAYARGALKGKGWLDV
jgi:uncharacterized damage-inducible protein DinB